MAFKFFQTRPNTITYHQTRSNITKQGVQTVKCLFTKQCLMVFGRQAFLLCPGPYNASLRSFYTVPNQYLHVCTCVKKESESF